MALEITADNFIEEVESFDGTVLIDFWAPWCGPCRMVSPIIDEIAKENSDPMLKIGKVNVDNETELAQKFGVMSIPTLIVMKNGEIVNKAIGARSKDAILDLVKQQ